MCLLQAVKLDRRERAICTLPEMGGGDKEERRERQKPTPYPTSQGSKSA